VSFAEVINNTSDIAECFEPGLQALGANSSKVSVASTRELEGSVDIDTCVKNSYPNDVRWDYVFGYKNRVYFVEVHPANTGEVKTLIKKLNWLKEWRKRSAPKLEALKGRSAYHWIASGKIAIVKKSRYNRMLAQAGISGPSPGVVL